MATHRILKTSWWEDEITQQLKPDEKLIWLWAITNPHSTLVGAYKVSLATISFETGLPINRVSKGINALSKLNKVHYVNNYVIVVNFVKHQNLGNSKIQAGMKREYENLPEEIRLKINLSEYGIDRVWIEYGCGMDEPVPVPVLVPVLKEHKHMREFENFWKLYPKKKAKKDTLSEWLKLSDEERVAAAVALPAHIASDQWALDGGKFVPEPHRWLKKRRWEDEVAPPSPSKLTEAEKLKKIKERIDNL